VPQPIRLCYLATHTSGLPVLPGNMHGPKHDPYATYSRDDLYDFLRDFQLSDPIGFDYRHSELGMALLGHALERQAGLPFAKLMKSRVLDSLGMDLAGYGPAPMVQGYEASGRPAVRWSADVMAPAIGMHASMNGMMKFLAANVDPHRRHIVDVLDYTHNPRIMIRDGKKETEIGLGWKVSHLGDSGRMVWSEGRTGGCAVWIGFNEANHTGVVILASVARDPSKMGHAILELLTRERLQ
jgi:CubicO group peptidase (beta-lactamase class C family)